jgi:thiamine transport system substrate-binding protein
VTRRLAALVLVVAAAGGVASCGSDDSTTSTDAPTPGRGVTLTLLAYDSFTPSEGIFDEFTQQTGIEVETALGGDAGELVAKASLTAGNPEGDVLWGVDNTLLGRALDADVFEPYESPALEVVPPELQQLVPDHQVTPVDAGDVCVNYDIAGLDAAGVEPPTSLADLTDPRYRGMLVVQDPATSSPGLAFLLASIADQGEDGWQQWWADLAANDVAVVDGWTEAYYDRFSATGGDRPMVVSYGTSPPAEVVFADPPVEEPPTGVVASTCFRQVEFAGVLRGTEHPAEARLLIDYLLGRRFQEDLPLTLFVYPASTEAALPQVFQDFAVRPRDPLTLDPEVIDANRQQWIDEWTNIVLR